MNNTLHKTQEVFRNVFGDQTLLIKNETTTADIPAWDSLTHMELIAEVESSFAIQFSLEEVMHFNCVGDMIACIDQKMKTF